LKFAAIDIGSNAIRLLIEEAHLDEGKYHIEKVSLTRVPVRLGEDVFTNGKISKEKIRQLVKTMRAFWYLMEVHQVVYFRVCATSAMREAKNRKAVLGRVKKEANLSIEILSGDEEAELIFSNYLTQNLRTDKDYLYIDVGGGSTELTLIQAGKRIKGKSFDLGTVRILSNAVKPGEWEKLKTWVQSSLQNGQQLLGIGTGGNINTMFKVQGKKPSEYLSLQEIKEQYVFLKSHTFDQRVVRLRMKPDRADVILPAAEIYLRIMEYAGIEELMVPKIGLSDGIILDMFNSWKTSKSTWQRDFICED
jgi:exopolyphosphatase / guanosine-5'-triphosphate,3'-diphosphate pyrophosphatase